MQNGRGQFTDFEKYLIERIDRLEERVVKLRVFSSVWGGLAGLASSIIAYLLKMKGL
jgi:hypothetical protein